MTNQKDIMIHEVDRDIMMHEVDRYIIPVRALSFNVGYRIMRNRFITSEKGRDYKKQIVDFFERLPDKRCHTTKIKLSIDFFLKTNRKMDIDNITKLFIDACKGILYRDDDLVYEFHARKFIGQINNEIHVEIEQVPI